ncbi:MAG: hypothetical protein AB7F75_13150 [Planctomycetota bacterium]
MFEHVDLGSVGVSGTVSRELRRVLSSVEALVEDGTLDVGGTLGEAIGVLSRLAGVRVSASVRECDAEIAKCRGEALVERLMRFLNHDYSVRRNDDTLSAWELGVDVMYCEDCCRDTVHDHNGICVACLDRDPNPYTACRCGVCIDCAWRD